jgi:hypothetical protein
MTHIGLEFKYSIIPQEEYAERRLNEDGLVFHKLKEFQQEVENLEKVMQVKQQELAQFLDLPLVISWVECLSSMLKFFVLNICNRISKLQLVNFDHCMTP